MSPRITLGHTIAPELADSIDSPATLGFNAVILRAPGVAALIAWSSQDAANGWAFLTQIVHLC